MGDDKFPHSVKYVVVVSVCCLKVICAALVSVVDRATSCQTGGVPLPASNLPSGSSHHGDYFGSFLLAWYLPALAGTKCHKRAAAR